MTTLAVADEAKKGDRGDASPRAAYVHVPFCAHKCGYCDFASVAGQDELADRYLDALDLEMARILGRPRRVETIFVGGGTPTYLTADQLARLLSKIAYWLSPDPSTEFTVESNPNTLSEDKIAVLAQSGVNRVSLGAQSFEPTLLNQLERNHDPHSVPLAMQMLRPAIDNISIDLIFGIPGQTMEQWRGDLEQALALAPSHLSAYGLTYEKGTPLWKQRRLGTVTPVEETLEAEMYEHLLDRMSAAGFEHYEISNFAIPGRQCRHNGVYWSNDAYFGFGTGAAAYVGGTRTLNLRPLVAYLEQVENGQSPVCQSETLEPAARARETAVLMLRRLRGIDRSDFLERTGYSIDDLAAAAIHAMCDLGLLDDDGRRLCLTRAGLLLADGVLARFV